MADEKKSPAQRRQTASEAAESGSNRRQLAEKAQVVADRAAKMVGEAQKRQAIRKKSFSHASPFKKEAATTHAESIRFLNTEADIGLNLARVALKSLNPKRARGLRLAREAYDSVLKYLGNAAPRSEELKAIQQKMETLRELLKSLGEQL